MHGADLAPVVEVVRQAEHHEEFAARVATVQGWILGPGIAGPQDALVVEHPAQVGEGDGTVEQRRVELPDERARGMRQN